MKVIGSILIITCSVIISYFYEKNKKEEICALQELYRFFDYVKNQIYCFSCPLSDIYKGYKTDCLCVNELIVKQKIFIYNEDISKTINSCFSNLGKGYKQEQLKSLDYLLNELTKSKSDAENAFTQKAKVFKSISFFIACCIVILLV